MKLGELVNGMLYMVTNEQRNFFNQLKESDLSRVDLDERTREMAEQMCRAGLIDRNYDEKTESVIYKLFSK